VKKPRLVLSDAAIADVVEQADWYRGQSGVALAKRWERAVTSALFRVVQPRCWNAMQLPVDRPARCAAEDDSRVSQASALLQIAGDGHVHPRVVSGARDLENLF
jgi:plasmid stabilization system protein ParE